jgi:hypothetical protein
MDLTKLKMDAVTTPLTGKAPGTASFAEQLAATIAVHKAKFTSGRIGLDLDERGQPTTVFYFDKAGKVLSSSAFDARMILKNAQKFGISLSDLTGLGRQLDAANICYRPYELYGQSGSKGVDFDDLISAASYAHLIAFRPTSH